MVNSIPYFALEKGSGNFKEETTAAVSRAFLWHYHYIAGLNGERLPAKVVDITRRTAVMRDDITVRARSSDNAAPCPKVVFPVPQFSIEGMSKATFEKRRDCCRLKARSIAVFCRSVFAVDLSGNLPFD
jgi:uncharacterized protein (DUF2384 family)